MAAFDRQLRYTYVSRRVSKVLKQVSTEMIGQSMWTLFPEDAATGFQEACERVWATGKPVTVERY